MRMRTFCKFVELRASAPLQLRDATVVVDGHNFFFDSYQRSGLTHAFGCESDRYATYLRELLSMFKKANVTCYFLFQGGHETSELIKKRMENHDDDIIVPIFMKNVYREVLDEMGFDYVICEYESKKDLIGLARRLNCPILTYDTEICFSGLQYIQRITLELNECGNTINCRYFLLDDFLQKFNLTVEKMALFIVITDETIFPQKFFKDLLMYLKAPPCPYRRNMRLLFWLSRNTREQCLQIINNCLSLEDQIRFSEEESKVVQMIGRREEGGLGAECALRRDAARVAPADPRWFAKGVAAGHVATKYVNLYRYKLWYGTCEKEDKEEDDAKLLTLEIVKYAYDLLTNFNNNGFQFLYGPRGSKELIVDETYSVDKPCYEADVCVFENGWSELRALGLLEHFAVATCGAAWRRLARLPADARLLVLALVYFSRKRSADAGAVAVCVLLSYVTLGVVFEKIDRNNNSPKLPFAAKPILDSSTDKDDVTAADCSIAAAMLSDYHTARSRSTDEAPERWALYPLVQFQHVLSELASLNALCGAPLPPPALRRLYNGPLVYQLRSALLHAGDTTLFLDKLLSPAPTVYAFLNGLIQVYEEMVHSTE